MQKLKFIELFISDVFGWLTKNIFYTRQRRKNRMRLRRPHGMRQPPQQSIKTTAQHSMNSFSFEIKAVRKMHIYYFANH